MFLIEKELKSFKKKTLDTYEISLNDLYKPLTIVEKKINNIDRTSKRSVISMELLNDEMKEKNEQINMLKMELINRDKQEEKLAKKILIMLDQIDSVYRFAIQSQNELLINNISSLMKIIRKELREVKFEEIPTIGEIFNAELHECAEAIENQTKEKYEIIDVVKKGYKFKERVLRVATIIAVK